MTEKRDKHPSYAMIGVSRCFGGAAAGESHRFFGSPLKHHDHFISITVCEAEREHSLSADHYFAGKEILDLKMTASQFADMITSMNIGDGVPCTLIRVMGELKPEPPHEEPFEVERVQAGYEANIKGLVDEAAAMEREVEDILARPTLRKADRKRVKEILGKYKRHLTDSAPFALKQFREASSRVADVAKREVYEYVSAVARETGIGRLKERADDLALPEGEKEPNDD